MSAPTCTYKSVADGDLSGLTAACAVDRKVLVELLHDVDSGARASPLCVAAEEGQLEVMEWLLRQPEVQVDHRGTIGGSSYTPLIVATEYGHVEAVRKLLEAGADLNTEDCGPWSPLYIAVEHRQPRCLEVLLAQPGIDFSRRGYRGTAHELAVNMGEHQMAQQISLACSAAATSSLVKGSGQF